MSMQVIAFIVFVALVFDFINGFHDAANSIATVVSTRVLTPRQAVIWAAFFNFIAFLFFDLHVANTIGKGIISPQVVDAPLILAALTGAIVWDLVTWYYGIPSSSSHALIGGLSGAAFAKAGLSALNSGGLSKVIFSILLSPILGLVLGAGFMAITTKFVLRRYSSSKTERWFKRLQLFSAALYSLGHGGNDAQKTMGLITVLLFSVGMLGEKFHVPLWVVLSCHAAMGLGTLFGGWRIVKTMGLKLTRLKPVGGFCAETSGACTLFLATYLGVPVSTTHTITGSIVGVGTVTDITSVRWKVAQRIVWAWILTIPASSTIAILTWYFLSLIH